MNKRLQMLFIACNAVGYVLLAVTRFFRNRLSDFYLGFLEGFAIVCILIGFGYLLWCMVKKKNPYRVE